MKKKYILLSLLLLIPALVFGLTYEWVIDQMEYADDDAAQLAYVSSDVLNRSNASIDDEDMADISDWADVIVTKGEYMRINVDANDNATFAVLWLKARWNS